MRKWLKRALWGLVVLVAVGYLAACVWLRANETRLVFAHNLPSVPPSPCLELGQQRVEFGEMDETRLFAWVVPKRSTETPDYWLLFFHGSGDNVTLSADAYDDFRGLGFSVMAPEYPGYGESPGAPSEAAIEREAQVAYDYLRGVKRVPAENIVLFGGSVGAGIATDLASHVAAGALIDHSGFSSLIAIAQEDFPWLPIRYLIRGRLASDEKIGRVRMPVLIVHSADDERIPFHHAQRLFERAPSPKRLLTVHGPHGPGQTSALVNPRFFADIVDFLNGEAGFHLAQPLPSAAPVLAATIEAQGIDAAVGQYRALLAESPRRYNLREAELNRLGYALLEKKRAGEAIALLRLNAEHCPGSFNAFDSLGDAQVEAGQVPAAIESYRRSLTLNPDGQNYSRAKLDRLQQGQ